MSYNEREQIEWGNYWWENANQKCKRVLLVGDSVTRGYRSALNRILEEYGYAVDLCAMSATVTDELLGKLLNAFFGVEEYTYEYICLQIGGQHGFGKLCCQSDTERGNFKAAYRKIVLELKERCDKFLIISSTPTVLKEDLEKYNAERNREILCRNEIQKEVALEIECPYVDLWETVLNKGCTHTDYIHFDKEGNQYIAGLVADALDIKYNNKS